MILFLNGQKIVKKKYFREAMTKTTTDNKMHTTYMPKFAPINNNLGELFHAHTWNNI
jgi:hypothetical protein